VVVLGSFEDMRLLVMVVLGSFEDMRLLVVVVAVHIPQVPLEKGKMDIPLDWEVGGEYSFVLVIHKSYLYMERLAVLHMVLVIRGGLHIVLVPEKAG